MPKPFYITTAIDYTNGAPHIGHAYEKVLADVLARYHRLKGEEVFFLTGVDQHGQKVQQSAEKAGVAPQEFVDEITAKFIALWEKLEVKYDGWAATTDPLHKRCVQGILQRLYDEKQIYKDKQEGYYSIRQEQFLTDKERNENGEFGPEWGEVEHRTEENYYFRLAAHKDWLLSYLKSHPDCVTPDFRQTELINAVEKLSGDLCISRPKSRLSWGIELPFDPDYVTYVWFDALTNYISFAGYDPASVAAVYDRREPAGETIDGHRPPLQFGDLWPALHVIGKDILIPAHGIYWPIMLHSLGFPDEQMPKFLVHGWWNISGAKMSKSLGNVIDPNELADKYGAEALRYYLMADITLGQDADFSEQRLADRYRHDLGNALGNLLNRTLAMSHKYSSGALSSHGESTSLEKPVDLTKPIGFELKPASLPDFRNKFVGYCVAGYRFKMEHGGLHLVMYEILHTIRIANGLIDDEAPWKVAKHQDEASRERIDRLLYYVAESLRILAILLSPVLPKSVHGIFDQLNWKMDPVLAGEEARFSFADAQWGGLPDGHVVGKPTPLFPRIEADTPQP